MLKKHPVIKGAFILTLTGMLTRFIGFFYRIFLSQQFGAEGVGLYQLIFPLYALSYSFAVAGIEIALSRNVAAKISVGKTKEAKELLKVALVLTFILSCLVLVLVQANAAFIADRLLGDERCESLLVIMTYALPFSAIHSCICGYYLGYQETGVSAIGQLIEQIARVFLVYIIVILAAQKSIDITVSVAVVGLVSGEILSSIYCIYALKHSKEHISRTKSKLRDYRRRLGEIIPEAVPLTGNRVLLNILQSVEAVSIPRFLQLYGLTNSEALSIYGVLTGMALPCILFPSAITNSISTMMLPTVAQMQAQDQAKRMRSLIAKVAWYCFLMGVVCMGGFLLFGNFIGSTLFHSESAGQFIVTMAWICPFLYMNTTLISMLNGLGKTHISFTINSLGLLLRMASVFFLIPIFGIRGYLWGLLGSQIIITILSIWQLSRNLRDDV
ncbi:MAG: putative polysaccharide biosynthesis protein [Lachnospiraceae bacterium]